MGRPLGSDDAAAAPCHAIFCPDDLAFRLHAATSRMVAELDAAAAEMGLRDSRDWFVLAALSSASHTTQLELGRMVCVDKSTLIGMLDRLEKLDLVVRTTDPNDRRVRIPQMTAKGRTMVTTFAHARDTAEARVLDGFDAADRETLLGLLARVADRDGVLSAS